MTSLGALIWFSASQAAHRARDKAAAHHPARGPPLRDDRAAQDGEAVEPAPEWDEAAQKAPDFEVDQRLSLFRPIEY